MRVERVGVGGLRQRVGRVELEPFGQALVGGDPQPLVAGIPEAADLRDVSEGAAGLDQAARRERGERPHAVDELVDVAGDAEVVTPGPEIAHHDAQVAPDLALNVHVPRLEARGLEVRRDRRGRQPGRPGGGDRAVQTDEAGEGQRDGERRVGARGRHHVRHRLVPQERVSGPHRRLPVLEGIPHDPDARLEGVLGLVHAVPAGAHAHEGSGRGVEEHEPVLGVGGRHQAVEAKAQVQREVGGGLEAVLDEEPEGLLHDVARAVAERDREGVAAAGLEVGQAREPEVAGIGVEVGVLEAPPFPAELEGMAPAQVAHGVGEHQGGVGAALREARGSAEIQAEAVDRDLRQREGGRDADVHPVIGRVELCVRGERDVDPVEAEARLVHEPLAEDVRLVQGADLPVRLPGVPETGDRVPL